MEVSLDVGKGIRDWVVRAKEIQKSINNEAPGLRSSSIVLSSQECLVFYVSTVSYAQDCGSKWQLCTNRLPKVNILILTLLDPRLHDVESVSDHSWIKTVAQPDLRKLPPDGKQRSI